MVESTICFKGLLAVGCDNEQIKKALWQAKREGHKSCYKELLAAADNNLTEEKIQSLLEKLPINKNLEDAGLLSQLKQEIISGTFTNFMDTNSVEPSVMSQLLTDPIVYTSLEALLQAGGTLFCFNKQFSHPRAIREIASFEVSRGGESNICMGYILTFSLKIGLGITKISQETNIIRLKRRACEKNCSPRQVQSCF